MNFERIKTEATGKWAGIFQNLGIDVGTGKHQPCPHCGGKDRFRFDNRDGKGSYFCGGCGAGDGFSLIMKITGVDFKTAIEEVAKIVGSIEPYLYQKEKSVSPQYLREIFKNSEPVKQGDGVHEYLSGRGLTSMPSSLRYTMKCHEPETGQEQEAMLALFTVDEDDKPKAVTMHRTFLSQGKKLDIKSPKKTLPTLQKMTGGAVRLYAYESGILGVSEGIETAIACHIMNKIPIWPTLSTALMESFQPPKNVESLIVYGDNDTNFAGQKAAYTLANRMAIEKKISVEVDIPDEPGTDWLDFYNKNKG